VLAHAALGQACWRRYEATLDTAWLARARQAIDTALELDPAQPLIRLARARVFESEGRPGEAIQELRTVQRLQPGNDASHRQLGLIHLRGGRTDEALEELRQAVALRPEYWANHQDLGVALFRAGHFSQAADEFERVTVLKPENAWGHQMLGTAHHAQGDTARALESYRRAVELTPDAGAYTNMGIIHYSEGRLPEAIADFERAARLEPGQLLMHRNLGDAYRRAGRRREAEASYREAVRLGRLELNANPRSAETLAAVAVCEAKLGRFPDARAHAAAAVALAPEHSDVLYDRAVVQSLAGDLEEALASLATAIDRGYSPSQAREDEDLAPLRGSPRFEELVGVAPAT
jgi:tetratricopeptide (TPR) repeat protein